jgi:uncharacterized protein YndB with AHSA1/START domain
MSDDYTVINREIIIDAPIEKVFSAVSDQDQLTHWFVKFILRKVTILSFSCSILATRI